MARWKIEPSWKKSLIERMYYHKGDNTIMVETGWRWGSFECETEDDNVPVISAGDDLYATDYDVELIETWDGCWEEHDMDDCDEETQGWLEEFLEENSFFDLEEHGWVAGDTEMIIDCDPIFERLDGPDAGKRYDVDGDEIPSDEAEEEVTETSQPINPETKAAWPFSNATEPTTEYAKFKCTNCDYETEDIMDLVDNPNDDDNGAYLCPECNSKVELG